MIARCQLHKIRNVESKLPDDVARVVVKEMRAAYANPDALAAQGALKALAKRIERSHPGAAGSLREGLAETLTIARLGVPPTLARTLRSTNAVESMIEICRDHSRNVKRWRDGEMALRWCAAGMVEAEKQIPTRERPPAPESVAHCARAACRRDRYTPPLQCTQGGGRLAQQLRTVIENPHRSGHPRGLRRGHPRYAPDLDWVGLNDRVRRRLYRIGAMRPGCLSLRLTGCTGFGCPGHRVTPPGSPPPSNTAWPG